MSQQFPLRLQALCREHQWGIQDLMQITRVGRTKCYNLLKGIGPVDLAVAHRIAKEAEVTLDWLAGTTPNRRPLNSHITDQHLDICESLMDLPQAIVDMVQRNIHELSRALQISGATEPGTAWRAWTVIEDTGIPYAVLDGETWEILNWNDHFVQTMRLTEEQQAELPGMNILDLCPPHRREIAEENLRNAVQTGSSSYLPIEFTAGEGATIKLQVNSTLKERNGRPVLLCLYTLR